MEMRSIDVMAPLIEAGAPLDFQDKVRAHFLPFVCARDTTRNVRCDYTASLSLLFVVDAFLGPQKYSPLGSRRGSQCACRAADFERCTNWRSGQSTYLTLLQI